MDTQRTGNAGTPTSLAVLPCRTLAEHDRVEFLEVGIADSIIIALSNASQLRVRSTSAILQYEGLNIEPHEVGRALNAEYLLTCMLQPTAQTVAASGGPQYGVLQKCAYSLVIFLAAPLMVLTGLTMAPAVTAGFPMLLRLFGGYQSARTIHFFAFVALLLFVVVHLVMVIRSGFRRQIRAMTVGD